ncbi:MAG: hypothetical protein IIX63_07120 [Treponema sp.]|nr:hypothetical protein [Treponema sp.]MBQ5848122.1 hypothetical protein [Treponema sp.]
MKKLTLFFLMLTTLSISICTAETYRYMYLDQELNTVSIMDTTEYIDKEKISNIQTNSGKMILPLNSDTEIFAAECGLKEISGYYYSGELTLIYLNYFDKNQKPTIKMISSWSELLDYVRHEK